MPKKPSLHARMEALVGPKRDKGQDEEEDEVTKARFEKDTDDEEDDLDLDFAKEKSHLRTRNAPNLADSDPRYRGKKASRKDLDKSRGDLDEKEHASAEWGDMFQMGDEDDEEGSDGEDEEGDVEEEEDSEEEEGDGEEEEASEEEGDIEEKEFEVGGDDVDFAQFGSISDEEESEGDDGDEEEEEDDEGDDDVSATSSENDQELFSNQVEDEVAKGKAIKAQLKQWEALLEARIQLQKVLVKINQFPQHDTWKEFKEAGDEQHRSEVKKSQAAILSVMDGLVDIQTQTLNSNKELKRMADKDEQEDLVESAPKKQKIAEYERLLEARHDVVKPYQDATIAKWNDKTRLAAGVVNKKSFSGFETSTLKQIEHILSDKSRLVLRTQTKRSAYRVLGKKEAGEEEKEDETRDANIFDDDDFYHQLLRELIDRKTADVTDPTQLGKHWLQLQKMRSKSKRNVDTKASKGRKTRYDIHAKLVNFMAPDKHSKWKDEAMNELFSSLFGKGGREH